MNIGGCDNTERIKALEQKVDELQKTVNEINKNTQPDKQMLFADAPLQLQAQKNYQSTLILVVLFIIFLYLLIFIPIRH